MDRLAVQDKTINELQNKLIDNARENTNTVERIMRELGQALADKAAAERELKLIQQGWRPMTGEGT